MPEHPGLLRAIIDEPDDDARRLIYADWLDDHSEHDRAGFIRAQLTYERLCVPGDQAAQGLNILTRDELFDKELFSSERLHERYADAFLAPLVALGLPRLAPDAKEVGSDYPAWIKDMRLENLPDPTPEERLDFGFYFQRGFIEGLVAFARPSVLRFLSVAEAVFAATPLRHLRLTTYAEDRGSGYGPSFEGMQLVDRHGRVDGQPRRRIPTPGARCCGHWI